MRSEKLMEVRGPSGKTSQDGGAQAIKTGQLKFSMDGMEAEGPKLGIQSEGWEGTVTSVPGLMGIAGIACVIGGGVWLAISKLSAWKSAGAIMGIGGILLVGAFFFETYPLVALALILAVVGGAGFILWQLVIRKRLEAARGRAEEETRQVGETLSVVARAVEAVGKEDAVAAGKVKAMVGELAGKFESGVKDLIGKAKAGTLSEPKNGDDL